MILYICQLFIILRIASLHWYPSHSIKRVLWLCYNKDDILNHSFPALTHLSFTDNYNDPLGSLPLKLQQLHFGRCFNQPLPSPLPAQLTRLSFGEYYNKKLTSLPHNLTHLVLGVQMSSPPPLPPSITHLTIHSGYNPDIKLDELVNLQLLHCPQISQPIPGLKDKFPKLTHLIASYNFEPPLDTLPVNLKYLFLGSEFYEQKLDNQLPNSLTHLIFPKICGYNHPIANLPHSLTHLVLPLEFEIESLPPRLTHLYIGPIHLGRITFPPTLTHLTLGGDFNNINLTFPPSLTHLAVEGNFATKLVLAPSLTHFSAGEYPYSLDTLPETLTHLYLARPSIRPANLAIPVPDHVVYFSLPSSSTPRPPAPDSVTIAYHENGDRYFWKPRHFESI